MIFYINVYIQFALYVQQLSYFRGLFMSKLRWEFRPFKVFLPRFSGTFVCRELRQGWLSDPGGTEILVFGYATCNDMNQHQHLILGCQMVPKAILWLFSLVNSEISSVLCMCNYNCSSGLVTDIMFKAPTWTGNSITYIYIYTWMFFVRLLESIISLHFNWLKYRPANATPWFFEFGSTP